MGVRDWVDPLVGVGSELDGPDRSLRDQVATPRHHSPEVGFLQGAPVLGLLELIYPCEPGIRIPALMRPRLEVDVDA